MSVTTCASAVKRLVCVGASAVMSGGASSNDLASGGGGGQSSSSRTAEPGVEPAPPGGGGRPSSTSRAAEPGDVPGEDLEVSSNSSGETLEAAALPEGLDVNWAQRPQTWHVARWCVARAHSVCRRVARLLAATNTHHKEWQKLAAE